MIVYGKNVIKEAIYKERKIYKLYVDEKFKDKKFLDFLNLKNVKYELTNKGKLNNLASDGLHQGILADVENYEYKNLEDVLNKEKIQKFLILDGIQDPHNLGAILRSADATSFAGIIMAKKNQVLLNGVVAKVSSGAIEHVNVILVGNLVQTIIKLKSDDFLVIGSSDNADILYNEIPKDKNIAIVLGNEGEGIRHLVKQNCNMLVKIPMLGKINSLNVSVAAAILMYATI